MSDLIPYTWELWLRVGGTVLAVVLAALLGHTLFFGIVRRLAGRGERHIAVGLARHAANPARLLLPLAGVYFLLPVLPLARDLAGSLRHAVLVGLIVAAGWLATALIRMATELVYQRYAAEGAAAEARRARTRSRVLARVLIGVVAVVTAGAVLMTFPGIRNLGLSLFASAGVAGLVIGLAARPLLSNWLAGVQIALTQPIRLDDAVVIEGEYGTVEDIRTGYVVVRTWDLRRLIVPLAYFLEKPFQNWTREGTRLIGTVYLYTDYTVPVEAVRREALQVLEASGLWDGKVWGVQATDATEHSLQLRVIASAADASTAWDLRCHLRERLVAYLQTHHPESLPRSRTEIPPAALARMAAAPDGATEVPHRH